MAIEIKSWLTGEVIFRSERESVREAVIDAAKSRADLSRANLYGADLSRADLYANRHAIRERANEAALRSRDFENDDPRPGAFTNDELADVDGVVDGVDFRERAPAHDVDFGA